jgi:hypothetical protein
VIVAGLLLWVVGIVIALPFVFWWGHDFSRIPGRVWYWTGLDRRPWQWAILLGLAAGGWIATATVIRWRYCAQREILLDELADRSSHRSRS